METRECRENLRLKFEFPNLQNFWSKLENDDV